MRYQTALHSAEAMAGEYTVHLKSATGKFIFVQSWPRSAKSAAGVAAGGIRKARDNRLDSRLKSVHFKFNVPDTIWLFYSGT
ncbi:hypothetical protein AGR8A_Cc30628 [Agrobacterium fabrum str. J-07]|nr:hypothetical protein AGR8A_Cc30628 [Agrobacterium fabrum str. J-07]